MTEILILIDKTAGDLREHRSKARVSRDWAMPWLYGTRLHALLDCYAAIGGDVCRWRNKAGVLTKDLK